MPNPTQLQKVQTDLIAELDKRLDDKIIETTNADLLKKLINNAETVNEAIMIAELGTTYKRTGFHFDKRLEKMGDTIKYFKKNEKLSFTQDPNSLTHKLIIGDNYDALLNLLIEYRSKIDVIYIDPPYGKDSMGEFAQTNYENAITRDNLLSMMYPRLVLARQLLSDNGVIFCSIDDKNQAYVKGLFDEVFGEGNFVGEFIINSTPNARDYGHIGKMHEYCLFYAKSIDNLETKMIEEENKQFTFIDEKGGFNIHPLYNSNEAFTNLNRPNLYYPFYLNMNKISKDGFYEISLEKEDCLIEIYPPLSVKNNVQFVWRWGKEKSQENLNKEIIGYQTSNGEFRIVQKMRHTSKIIRSILSDVEFSTRKGTAELEDIFTAKLFVFPKPVNLIKTLIYIATNENSIILDFFAGSGTTGQAVLELNKQDGGKRQFILATANEITDTTPNGIVNDVTSKRLKRVMTGQCYDGTTDFKWNDKHQPLGDNLDIYDIGTVANFEATDGKTPFDVIDETLYGKEKLSVNEKIQWVCENFEGTQRKLES
jgi:adenine-specific DNA-methyltransferase